LIVAEISETAVGDVKAGYYQAEARKPQTRKQIIKQHHPSPLVHGRGVATLHCLRINQITQGFISCLLI
jgi:hypothetical protein